MTKAEVVELVVHRTGMKRQQAFEAVEIFLDNIKQALKTGEKVSLVGFGTFLIKKKNARNGRNPRTGRKITIPDKNIPIFKPGKAFREAVAKRA